MRKRFWYIQGSAADPVYRRQVALELLAGRRRLPEDSQCASGHVLEFLKSGRPMCGIVLGRTRKGYRVLDVEGKEDVVDRAKVMDISSCFINPFNARHELLHDLRQVNRERDQITAAIDPFELWAAVESEGRDWTLDELSELYFIESPGPHDRACMFRALADGRAFVRHGAGFVALSPERVAANLEEDRRHRQAETRLQQAAAWLRCVADGDTVPRPPDADHAIGLLAAKVLFGSEHPDAARASALAEAAGLHSQEAVFAALVKAGHWSADENLDILREGIPTEFSPAALAEAAASEPRAAAYPRLWFRRIYAFTDDASGSQRAFSIRRGLFGYVVGIHLSCPALLIRPDGKVQQEAQDRAASLRLPDRLIPMLPQAVIDRAALACGKLRPSLTIDLQLGRRLELRSFRVYVSRVAVTRALSSREVKSRLMTDWGLRKLQELARHVKTKRIAAGAVAFGEPSVKVRVRDGHIRTFRAEPDEPARSIEKELSILANALAGRFCRDRDLPAIYRTQDASSELLVDPWRHDPVASYRQRRVTPGEHLSTQPSPQHGLGIGVCACVDRPWERHLDLLVHQQILAALEGGRPPWTESDLKQAVQYTASARDTVGQIESKARRYWLLRYLESHVGEEVAAVILATQRSGYWIELVETRLWAFCAHQPEASFPPGTRIQVQIIRPKPRADTILLSLVGPAD